MYAVFQEFCGIYFLRNRSLCVHQTTALFCPFPLLAAAKHGVISERLIPEHFTDSDSTEEIHRQEVVGGLLLKPTFPFLHRAAWSPRMQCAAPPAPAQPAGHARPSAARLGRAGAVSHPTQLHTTSLFGFSFSKAGRPHAASDWEQFLACSDSQPCPRVVGDSAQDHPVCLLANRVELWALSQCPQQCSAC